MRRTVWMTTHDLEELSRGSGGVDGILSRLETVEPKLAVFVGTELAAQVVTCLVLGIEDIILAVGAGLPHIKDGAWNPLSGIDVRDNAMEVGEFAVLGHVLNNAGAKVAEGSLGRPE